MGTKGGQIWSPTLEFLQKCIFFKNDPPPLGTLKYPPEDQFEIFMILKKNKQTHFLIKNDLGVAPPKP